jgi:undecaprenyl-diphosphatase
MRLAIPREWRILRFSALILAHSGDSLLWLLAAAIALIWGNTAWQGFGGRVVAATLAVGSTTVVLKWVFRRKRPPGESRGSYSRFDRHSFPSGHAGRCACIAFLLCPLLPVWGLAPLVLWAGLVGLARVALQIHFISDVVSGWLAGILVGMILQVTFCPPA